jgi:tetratricopeptide (TPR) repeat protein
MARSYLQIYQGLSEPTRALLHRLHWFAEHPIPSFLFDGQPDATYLEELHQAQVLNWQEDRTTFTLDRNIHSLPRYAILPADGIPESLIEALGLLDQFTPNPPDDSSNLEEWTSLAPHIAAVAGSAANQSIPEPTAKLLNGLGVHLTVVGQWNASENFYHQGLQLLEATGQQTGRRYWAIKNNLGQLLQATNRLEEAESVMRSVLKNDEETLSAEDPNVATDLMNLASLLQDTNRVEEAEHLMRTSLKIDEDYFGPEHAKVATDLNNLAQLLKNTARFEEAEPLMRRALAIDETNHGLNQPKTAIRLNNLAQLLKATHRLEEAEALTRRALTIFEESYGPQHRNVATAVNNLALLLQATNRGEEAELLLHRALKIDQDSFGPDHPKVATRLNNLASLLQSTNRLEEAEPLMRRALKVLSKCSEASHPNTQMVSNNYRSLLSEMGLTADQIEDKLRAIVADAVEGD